MNHCLRSFLICLAMAAAVWAQNIRGNIVGQVTDSSGSALAGATVSVLNQGTGILVNAAVDGSGNYTVPNLDAGRYTITVKKEGFRTIEVKDVELLASKPRGRTSRCRLEKCARPWKWWRQLLWFGPTCRR